MDEVGVFEHCIGAGRLEGWFCTSSYDNEKKGWGHLESDSFEGHLFFHLQRSPSLRGVRYFRKDAVAFEVVEFNGRCEAVKLLLPSRNEEQNEEAWKPEPREVLGQTVEGRLSCSWQLVKAQNWGFVVSEYFKGTVFWHVVDNPEMVDLEFSQDDVVEFELYINTTRGDQVRARKMKFLRTAVKDPAAEKAEESSQRRMEKKQRWLVNWRKGPPPDWICKGCSYPNFGRNKTCKVCGHPRPPREEWPPEEQEEQQEVSPALPTFSPVAPGCQAHRDAGSFPLTGPCLHGLQDLQAARLPLQSEPASTTSGTAPEAFLPFALGVLLKRRSLILQGAVSASLPRAAEAPPPACFAEFNRILGGEAWAEGELLAKAPRLPLLSSELSQLFFQVKAYLDGAAKSLGDGKAKQAQQQKLRSCVALWWAEEGKRSNDDMQKRG
ncbi:IFT25 [Symbiodinium sp. CCMP2592]|nr:IFT25 [Symbiodinium sp. CCMP2592]